MVLLFLGAEHGCAIKLKTKKKHAADDRNSWPDMSRISKYVINDRLWFLDVHSISEETSHPLKSDFCPHYLEKSSYLNVRYSDPKNIGKNKKCKNFDRINK